VAKAAKVVNLVGRPSKRTPEIEDKLAECISYGLTTTEACRVVKISIETFRRWDEIPEFHEKMESGKAQRLLIWLKDVESGKSGWQSKSWMLERQMPARFGRPEVQVAIGTVGKAEPIQSAFFLAGGDSMKLIDDMVSSQPIEVHDTPAVEIEATVTTDLDAQLARDRERMHPQPVPVDQSAVPAMHPTGPESQAEGTSVQLLRTGNQEGRPELRPKSKYTVASARSIAAAADQPFLDLDSNKPI
jgi:hypothetical protein